MLVKCDCITEGALSKMENSSFLKKKIENRDLLLLQIWLLLFRIVNVNQTPYEPISFVTTLGSIFFSIALNLNKAECLQSV